VELELPDWHGIRFLWKKEKRKRLLPVLNLRNRSIQRRHRMGHKKMDNMVCPVIFTSMAGGIALLVAAARYHQKKSFFGHHMPHFFSTRLGRKPVFRMAYYAFRIFETMKQMK
jgi:hypothetical protein